jgi:hypothetical protein
VGCPFTALGVCVGHLCPGAVQKEIRGVITEKKYKYKPTDLREKKTRAIRRRLTLSEVRVAALRPPPPSLAALSPRAGSSGVPVRPCLHLHAFRDACVL